MTSLRVLKEAGIEKPDAIITATSLGMIDNSEKFLNDLVENDETLLKPTLFMQSTHNTIGSSLAIRLGCHGYNITYAQGKDSLEWAKRDAVRLIKTGKANSVLVGLHDEKERQLMVLRKMMRFTAFISFPLLFGLGLVSQEFIVLAIGEKWAFSASLLPYLCLCGAFMPLSTLLTDAIISQHRSDIYLWSTIALGILQIGLMISLWRKGIYTMVIAYTVLNILWMFVWHFFVHRLMRYNLLDFIKDIVPFALAATAVMAVTGFVTDSFDNLWLRLISRFVIAVILYYAVMRISGAVILKECIAFITKKKSA
jgi:hypothetical protein